MRNNFFSRLTPKEPKFFPLLTGLADVIAEIIDVMIEFLSNYKPETAESYYKRIKEVERKGDRLINQIFDELNVSFITPFDREDINDLSETLDDVNDFIDSSAKRIYLYKPEHIPQAAIDLGETLRESAVLIGKSVNGLNALSNGVKEIKGYCDQLHIIENKADDIYEHFLMELFQNEKDAIEIIKLNEIVAELENATDAAERVAKIIKKILVKYA